MPNQGFHRNSSAFGFAFLASFFCAAQLIVFQQSQAEDLRAEAVNFESTENFLPILVNLSINQQTIADSILVLRDKQGQWMIPLEALSRARIRLPQNITSITYLEKKYIPVSFFKGSKEYFSESSQSLEVRLDALAFEPNALMSGMPGLRTHTPESAGAFVNYDFLISGGSGQDSQSLFTEIGAAINGGTALANLALIRQEDKQNHFNNQFVRLDTSYVRDDLSNLTTWRLGDAISRPATSLGRPVRFGGIQYSTNFHLQPGLITVPVPTLNGQAALPSMVDLYVNNVLQSSSSIPPGPFSITTAPIVSGDGEVLVRVKDISGREQLISGQIYSSPMLLAPGLSDFSFEAGALRKNFGIEYNDYGDLFGSASYRRGITDKFTLEGGLNALNSGLFGALGSATYAIPGWGTTSLAAGLSAEDGKNGIQYAAAFERRSRNMSFSFRSERSDDRYRQIGIDPEFRIRALDTAFWNYRFNDIGNLGLSFTRQERAHGTKAELIGASFSTPKSRLGSFIVSAFRSRDDNKNYSLGLYWILPIDSDWSASVSHTSNQGSPDSTVFQAQKSAPYSEGFGWRVQAAINAAQQAALIAQHRFGTARIEAGSFQGQESARIGLSGAVANIEGQWFPTRRIGGSYGLVHLPGLSNIRVYVDNQLMARTDENGLALLPRLHPYVGNHVSIEQMDLPLDTKIDALIVRPVPAWRSGVIINFPVRKMAAATMRLVDEKGHDIPAGASLTVNQGAESFAVGRDGLAYIEGVSLENTVRVSWPGHKCEISFDHIPSQELIPYLGEFECKESRQ